jgi:hypothetical protein
MEPITRVIFRDTFGNEFSGELVGYQIVLDGDGCDLYFDSSLIEVVSVFNLQPDS